MRQGPGIELRQRLPQLAKLLFERANVFFDAAEPQSFMVQINLCLLARGRQMLQSPGDRLARHRRLLQINGNCGSLTDRVIRGFRRRFHSRLAIEHHQHHDQGPHRAQQDGHEREQRNASRGNGGTSHAACAFTFDRGSSTVRASVEGS